MVSPETPTPQGRVRGGLKRRGTKGLPLPRVGTKTYMNPSHPDPISEEASLRFLNEETSGALPTCNSSYYESNPSPREAPDLPKLGKSPIISGKKSPKPASIIDRSQQQVNQALSWMNLKEDSQQSFKDYSKRELNKSNIKPGDPDAAAKLGISTQKLPADALLPITAPKNPSMKKSSPRMGDTFAKSQDKLRRLSQSFNLESRRGSSKSANSSRQSSPRASYTTTSNPQDSKTLEINRSPSVDSRQSLPAVSEEPTSIAARRRGFYGMNIRWQDGGDGPIQASRSSGTAQKFSFDSTHSRKQIHTELDRHPSINNSHAEPEMQTQMMDLQRNTATIDSTEHNLQSTEASARNRLELDNHVELDMERTNKATRKAELKRPSFVERLVRRFCCA